MVEGQPNRLRGRARPAAGPARRRVPILGLAGALVALGLLVLVAFARIADAHGAGPRLSVAMARVDRVEGDADAVTVPIPVMLDAPAAAPVTVTVTTVDGTATAADHDYAPVRRRVRFASGTTAKVVTVPVVGDTRTEDDETLAVRLESVHGARLGRSVERIRILNDDRPRVLMSDVHIGEGGVAGFRAHLSHPYDRPVVATVETTDAGAIAPADYTPLRSTVVFPSGSTRVVPIAVATAADSSTEGPERFDLTIRSADLVGPSTATATIVETRCPSGAPVAAPALAPAPLSPSSPPTSSPPAAVTGGARWDVVFRDDFDRPAFTAAHWTTGMRSGAQTLEGNQELEWYTPANSVLTSDSDGGRTVSVLQQRLTTEPVPGAYYPVGVLRRLYPPAQCPQYYDPLHLLPEDASRVPYRFRSGMLNSAKSFAFEYGYVEARVRMPKGFALWPALWLRDWKPWSYELDVLEGFDRDARTLRGTYWWGTGSNVSTGTDGDVGIAADGSPCRGARHSQP